MQLTDTMTYRDLGKGQLVHKASESNIHQFSGALLRLGASFYLAEEQKRLSKRVKYTSRIPILVHRLFGLFLSI